MTTQRKGSRALRFAERWLDPVTVQRVVVPAVADLEHELRAAPASGFSRWRIALRGYWGLSKAIAWSFAADAGDHARPSLAGITLRMAFFFPVMLCLAMIPFADQLISGRFSGIEGQIFLLLVPQAVALALPGAYLFAAALDRQAASPTKLIPAAMAVSIAIGLASLVSSFTVVPHTNQAYRQLVFDRFSAGDGTPGGRLAPGPNELTLGDILRDARRAGPAGDAARLGLSNRLAAAALPVVFGIIACGIAGRSRRRWLILAQAAFVLALWDGAARAVQQSPFAAPAWEWLWLVVVNGAFTAIGLGLIWWRSRSTDPPVAGLTAKA